jgi:hypothetical protein
MTLILKGGSVLIDQKILLLQILIKKPSMGSGMPTRSLSMTFGISPASDAAGSERFAGPQLHVVGKLNGVESATEIYYAGRSIFSSIKP